MVRSILMTQCLQNDFVRPIGRYDGLPNVLHIGFEEARRLMGEKPGEGPVARTIEWASGQPAEVLAIIHIRDWHDPQDASQRIHLARFGNHCIAGSEGAKLVFDEDCQSTRSNVAWVSAVTLNDFLGTSLASTLESFAPTASRVGLMGVWTEAKVSFLAYELATRYPHLEIAVCSALTASSSRAQHFVALDQMVKILGVTVIDSVGQFIEFLGGDSQAMPLLGFNERLPALAFEGEVNLKDQDQRLLRYLFRDCKSATLDTLDGGFSGNAVLGSESVDIEGRRQVPHVVKIGPVEAIAKERTSFERIEHVLGNIAPRITDFADLGNRGAIKYRYASMGGGFSTTFQKRYIAGLPATDVRRLLTTVFHEQLGRLYAGATLEKHDLLAYYVFSPDWAPKVRNRVEAILGAAAVGPVIKVAGREAPNVCEFYEKELPRLPRRVDYCYVSYIHGDLNGANIILDGQGNVWLIDFFHTHRGHVLKDLIKFENDLLYIFTLLEREADLVEALRLSDLLLSVADLAAPLPSLADFDLKHPALVRAYETLTTLRSFVAELVHEGRDPLQLLVGQMRYAVHTLSFDESSALQKQWALYMAGQCGARITERLERTGPLRIDWLASDLTSPGRMGLTILPGRRDIGRTLEEDMKVVRAAGVTHVVCCLSDEELHAYGADRLLETYNDAGLFTFRLPILDQSVCTKVEMASALAWIDLALARGGLVMVHCVGGLGRSGLVAASHLRNHGLSPGDAIAEVRRARSPRAIESKAQEEFVREYA
jgi:protein-tyrosine phosphatase/nicotinamidase-related amidase